MALNLKGVLNLVGMLTLKDKVMIDGKEALVELIPHAGGPHGTVSPFVNLPPPPAGPVDPGPTVWIINSFNKTVMVGSTPPRPIVALGMVMAGNIPTWPGMMQPSVGNPTVTINHIAINVIGDKALVFPNGGMATMNASGQ